MKYYIGQLECQHGEYEFTESLKFKTDNDPDAYLDAIAATWYETGDIEERRDCGGYWHNGEMLVKAGQWEEVTQELADAVPVIHYITAEAVHA